jgi:hypothetical protein
MGILVIAGAAIDIVFRAHQAYETAERYMDWSEHPDKKITYFQDRILKGRQALENGLAKKDLTQDIFDEKLRALQSDRDFSLNESSLKYAYEWYKDTYELFSPPASPWSRSAREKAPRIFQAWKEELRAKHIQVDETTLP